MNSLLKAFIEFAEMKGITVSSYLVGGTVRDILIGKELHDCDIAIKGDVFDAAKAFASKMQASFVELDKNFGIVRVVKNWHFIDFCRMHGDSIEADLSRRDFSINAMALPISSLDEFQRKVPSSQTVPVIDPYNGTDDLRLKIIRMVSEENLMDDPLRLLRAYRFASTLDFSIEINTSNAIRKLSPYISRVAVERITKELRHILKVKFSYKTIRDMHKSGLLLSIFPELTDISPETLHHTIRSYSYAEHVLDNLSLYFSGYDDSIRDYFSESYRIICLKLAALLRERNLSEKAIMRLKLSGRESEFIRMIIERYDKLLMLKSAEKNKKIAFLIQYGDDLYPLLIFSIANELICQLTGHPTLSFCKEMLEIYHGQVVPRKKFLPILTGNDLIEEFHLKPSPLFSKLLNSIEELYLTDIINSRQEALSAVEELIKKEQPTVHGPKGDGSL